MQGPFFGEQTRERAITQLTGPGGSRGPVGRSGHVETSESKMTWMTYEGTLTTELPRAVHKMHTRTSPFPNEQVRAARSDQDAL